MSAYTWLSENLNSSLTIVSWRIAPFQSSWRKTPAVTSDSNFSLIFSLSAAIVSCFSFSRRARRSSSSFFFLSASSARSSSFLMISRRSVVCLTVCEPLERMYPTAFWTFDTSSDALIWSNSSFAAWLNSAARCIAASSSPSIFVESIFSTSRSMLWCRRIAAAWQLYARPQSSFMFRMALCSASLNLASAAEVTLSALVAAGAAGSCCAAGAAAFAAVAAIFSFISFSHASLAFR